MPESHDRRDGGLGGCPGVPWVASWPGGHHQSVSHRAAADRVDELQAERGPVRGGLERHHAGTVPNSSSRVTTGEPWGTVSSDSTFTTRAT